MKNAIEWIKAFGVALLFTAMLGGLLEFWFRQQGL